MILAGDCVELMAGMEPESVDAIVTDPPYDLLTTSRNGSRRINNPDTPAGRSARGFMGKTWDGTGVAFRPETWAAALRVAKPGAHLLSFGGTRTYHRMTCAIEDAGWEIRDCLVWAYATGFPKSLNLPGGLGTALKPAWEPIVMARKPLRGTVAANVAAFGTGALAIDATRIPFVSSLDAAAAAAGFADSLRRGTAVQSVSIGRESRDGTEYEGPNDLGRWPANVLLTSPIFDGDTPGVVGGGDTSSGGQTAGQFDSRSHFGGGVINADYHDSGTYSRFFMVPGRSGVPSGTIGTCQTCGAPIAGQPSTGRTRPPDTALSSAATPPSEPLAQPVSDAVGLFDSPVIASVPSPARTPIVGTPESTENVADLDTASSTSVTDRNISPEPPPDIASLSDQPARNAAPPPISTATTTTTPSPSLCGRCADDAITGRTLPQPRRTRPALPVDGDDYTRFLIVPKADRGDREPVLGGLELTQDKGHRKTGVVDSPRLRGETWRQNSHPTVKPTDLMRHLVRLVTPAGGTVLDPFAGSGSTLIAAELEGFAWIGIEMEPEYVAIIEARLNGTQRGLGLVG